MTQEERLILLKDCNNKLEEIEIKKKQQEQSFENGYNKKYRRIFRIVDTLDSVVSSRISGILLVGSAAALMASGHSLGISVGVPIGGYVAVGISAVVATLVTANKKSEYWKELRDHSSNQDSLEEESLPYKLVAHYLEGGDKYALQLYRQSLDVTDDSKDEFSYLDFNTEALSPLMKKAIEEIRLRTIQLRDELRKEIIENIRFMQTQIEESKDVSILKLEEVQKMLNQHVPMTMNAQALTK